MLDELDRQSKQIAHEVITDLLMTLSLPGRVLSLGRDVPGTFPAELATIDNPDLRALLDRIDRDTRHHARQRRRAMVEPDRSNQLHRRPLSGLPG